MACPVESKEIQKQKGFYKNTTRRDSAGKNPAKALMCFRKRTKTNSGQSILEKKRVNKKQET
jgi:hypothetical protein